MSLIIKNKSHNLAVKVNKIMYRQILFATAFKTVECNIPFFVNDRDDLGNRK